MRNVFLNIGMLGATELRMFDPYHKWLGIPREKQPPDHYLLLGLQPGESDAEVIDEAAIRQMAHLRGYQVGPHAGASRKLLNEVAEAHATLINPAKRKAYEERLARENEARIAHERESARQAVTAQKPRPATRARRPESATELGDQERAAPRSHRRIHRQEIEQIAGRGMTLKVMVGIVLLLCVPAAVVGALYFVLYQRQRAAEEANAMMRVQEGPGVAVNPGPMVLNPNPAPVPAPVPVQQPPPPQQAKAVPPMNPAPPRNAGKPASLPAALANISNTIGRKIVHGVAVSPDGQTLVTSLEEGGTLQWNLTEGKQIRQLTTDRSQNLRFTGDGSTVLHANRDALNGVILA